MLGIETTLRPRGEPFRHVRSDKEELTALLQDPPIDYDEQVKMVPRVNYTVYNENRDLFMTLQSFYSSLCGKRIDENEKESFAGFLEQNRVAAVFRVEVQNSKKTKAGNRVEILILRAVSEPAREKVLGIIKSSPTR